MATAKKNTGRITLRIVLGHMQKMHQDMLKRFSDHDKKFESLEKNDRDIRLEMAGMERRLTLQIDGIDERLDDIEIKDIPNLKKAVAAR